MRCVRQRKTWASRTSYIGAAVVLHVRVSLLPPLLRPVALRLALAAAQRLRGTPAPPSGSLARRAGVAPALCPRRLRPRVMEAPALRAPEASPAGSLWDGDLWDALLAQSPRALAGAPGAAHFAAQSGSPRASPPPQRAPAALPAPPGAQPTPAELEGWSCADPSHRSNCIRCASASVAIDACASARHCARARRGRSDCDVARARRPLGARP
jgi:hypothetical protein